MSMLIERIPVEVALCAIQKLLLKGDRQCSELACAVVDVKGDPIAFAANDGCYALPRRISIRKAVTAALLRRPSRQVSDEVARGELDLAALAVPELLAQPGGVPVAVGGRIVGAVGVSGGSATQDDRIAAAIARECESILVERSETADAGCGAVVCSDTLIHGNKEMNDDEGSR